MAYYKRTIYQGFGNFFYPLIKNLFTVYYTLFRGFTVEGKENIPKDTSKFLVMSNHFSNNDPPVISSAISHIKIAYMAKEELFTVPIIGLGIKWLGAFSVNREKLEITTIKATKEIFTKTNWVIGMFLEGTRNKTPKKLGMPNPGPAYVAILNKVPILPVGIIGTDDRRKKITIKIGKPFYPDRNANIAMRQCAEKLCELTGQEMPDFQ